MYKIPDKQLRFFIIVLGIYLIGDGLIHLLNIKLGSVKGIWPQSAFSYAILLNSIYASFVFLVSSLILIAQKDLKKYKSLILVSSVWSVFHGGLLIYLSVTQNFMVSFYNLPSLYVWMSFYDKYLIFEALLAFAYALLVFLWIKND
jgi:uncharacterized membrane protein YozB (DUF420 family)